MKQCRICYNTISKDDYVELLIGQENYKYIIGKYKWVQCDYCFSCINVSRKLVWRLYINTLLTTDCKQALFNLLNQENNMPIWITDNLGLNGKPVKALFYKGQMHSSRLLTGLNDYSFYMIKEKITNIYKNLLQEENTNNKNIENIQTLLENISF